MIGIHFQVVLANSLLQNEIVRGSCVKVIGEVVPSTGKNQSSELLAKHCELLSQGKSNDFIGNSEVIEQLTSSKNTGLKPELARKSLLHLRHRLNYNSAIGRIRADTKHFIRNYMLENEYLEVDAPCLTSNDCEGAGETYKATIDGVPNTSESPKLTVSAQLHLEALVLGYSKVYSMGPVFRANKSKTRFHLSEFLMLEAESVNVTTVSELCLEIESLVQSVVANFIDSHSRDYEEIRRSNLVESDKNRIDFLSKIVESRFKRVPFPECVAMLKSDGLVAADVDDATIDLSKGQEQHLVQVLGGLPIFVTEFPVERAPFYCKSGIDGVAMATDLLLPDVGEVVGGTVREDDLATLKRRIDAVGLDVGSMGWYLDLRRGGGCPHGGFGLGFDRLVQFLTGVAHIQDVATFPRLYDTCVL